MSKSMAGYIDAGRKGITSEEMPDIGSKSDSVVDLVNQDDPDDKGPFRKSIDSVKK